MLEVMYSRSLSVKFDQEVIYIKDFVVSLIIFRFVGIR